MANIDMYKTILCELLDCGYLDLAILDDADEDFVLEAMDDLKDNGIPISLNGITDTMFMKVMYEIIDAIEVREDELGSDKENGYAGEYETEELEKISTLDPERDIQWYCNCLDTGIYICNDKYDVYKEYFGDLLDELEEKMGFEFGC